MTPHVLIIDDCKFTTRVLSGFVNELGFQAHATYSAEEAIRFIQTHELPSLFLVDWILPDMSGLELVTYIRGLAGTGKIPVVMVTAERDMKRIVEALRNGADEYIMKPFTKEIIEEKLRIVGMKLPTHHG